MLGAKGNLMEINILLTIDRAGFSCRLKFWPLISICKFVDLN